MPRTHRSDSTLVAIGRRAYYAIRSHLPALAAGTALFVLCVVCCVNASTAPATPLARSTSSHSSAPAKHNGHHRSAPCGKRASFHSSSGQSHHAKRRASCHAHRHKSSAPTFGNGPCTNTTLRPSGANLERARLATLCLVDRERTSRGESALRPDPDLQHAAQGHSQDMAAGDYFEHDGLHGETPLSRMRSAGYIYNPRLGYEVGENIAWGTLWMASPGEIVAGWMADPGHRANILDRTFRDTGIGIAPHPLASLARGQAGAIYTQDFGRILGP
jgi:uncharacterized protein YkwD